MFRAKASSRCAPPFCRPVRTPQFPQKEPFRWRSVHGALHDFNQSRFIPASRALWLRCNRTHNGPIVAQWDLPMVRREDEWVWGWDSRRGIVSVWANLEGRASVWRRIPKTGEMVREEARFRPWVVLDRLDDLQYLGNRLGPDGGQTTPITYRELDVPGSPTLPCLRRGWESAAWAVLEGAPKDNRAGSDDPLPARLLLHDYPHLRTGSAGSLPFAGDYGRWYTARTGCCSAPGFPFPGSNSGTRRGRTGACC